MIEAQIRDWVVTVHDQNDFFTKNRVKTALRVGMAIYFFVNENGA